MRFVDIIEKKRDGNPLTTEEIQFFITNYTNGTIPDYQVSALLMAIYYQGMTSKECADLTSAMMYSGETVDLSSIKGIKVDKHSTGGVGDTTTLVLAPLVAALGVPVAKMSGRGLGHTGGTNDKFESIAGFQIELGKQEFINQVNEKGVAVIGQSGNLTPADKKLYSLRDVTATVNSIPLIASSIMSKKLAAGADAIVLDVKTGDGALMKSMEDSEKLAREMVSIGNQIGRRTMAIISDMSQPLGFAIGNALEVKEAIDTLKGQGPADLTELVLTLGSQMVVLADKAKTLDEAREKLQAVIQNGQAIEKFKTLIEAQGGDSSVVDHPEKLASAPYQIALPALKSGYVSRIIADQIGIAAMQLGAGRATKDDVIDPAVGIVLHKKVGDKVEQGEALLTIHANTDELDAIKQKLYDNITISDSAKEPQLIYKIITE
ncbi:MULTISPECIES: pyrimidine-nucleoside phosphorylase [unclassified Gilliamella]|uniref:pyrimidine-nucleoside phosphorylase n=1 Tax=unclassified Gilliamella TaxID=2685620 RepID=UPI00226A1476|nr:MULTISPECIES: pyrimidine-nucleoside phosphorylase [unclassified Gilliamella]MCX8600692.1 pyrimidine-nucleoside phosphorylase [Gilliamella sp. B3722]MCX8609232.1 pyrimidine-nucleoside phosphorylase [Gilliamella sp. B3771]MCX8609909.1 pyrimidine-nucleoside phosphorylase [Gilliamella sp. B3891]MCX8612001.1 pyrimidine-nucleoside phosphorylase [Gilliamella sp. B3773]MCX8615505.1 pyrimidine-nucleoside phosphorylase [Gilliamella sp. B3770]